MVGTLAVELRNDLSFSKVALGGLVAIFSGLTAVLAIPAGRLVQRFGYRPGLVVAPLLAAVALLGPAVAAGRWWHLAAGQCVAALAASLAISSVPLALATRIPPERQGIAFGLNLSSVPASTLLAGLAVPLVAETVGWRWALGSTGALALVISFMAAVLLDNEQLDRVGRRRPFIQRRLVFLGSGAMFFGVWGAHSVATFAVEAGVEQGHTAGSIGYALGLASVMSIGGADPRWLDRRQNRTGSRFRSHHVDHRRRRCRHRIAGRRRLVCGHGHRGRPGFGIRLGLEWCARLRSGARQSACRGIDRECHDDGWLRRIGDGPDGIRGPSVWPWVSHGLAGLRHRNGGRRGAGDGRRARSAFGRGGLSGVRRTRPVGSRLRRRRYFGTTLTQPVSSAA